MRAPISVIVPTLNAEGYLGDCLEALMPGVETGLIRDLIVTDGGSSDSTVAIAKAWGAVVVKGPASRGGQLARGCAEARGDWILVLHADTVLEPGWVGPVVDHLRTELAGWFWLSFSNARLAGRIVAVWANLRSRMGLPYGDQGLLLPRGLYEEVGGYADQPLMEDVALVRALKGRLRLIDATVRTSASRYHAQGWVRRGSRNLWTLLRYFFGTSPHRLAESYRRQM